MASGMSIDFLIACVIREFNLKGEPIWFNRLVKLLEGKASRSTISQNVDKLFDFGIIDGDWVKGDKGSWVRIFQISCEAGGLVAKIAEKYRDDQDFKDVCIRMNE